jgi:hypothetical protein
MHEPILPAGYQARTPSPEDAPDVANMIAAYELDVFGNTEMTEDLLLDDWSDLDLSRDAVLAVAPDGAMAAVAYLFHHGAPRSPSMPTSIPRTAARVL